MLKNKTISFIGSGIMAEAMIRGLRTQDLIPASQIMAASPRPERGQILQERHGIQVTVDNKMAAQAGQIVVLSVKPQVVPTILPEIRGQLDSQDLVLSIIAGARIEKLANGLAHAAVVRAMPNTPAQISQGITVWTATNEVSPEHKAAARLVLGSLGEEIFMDDEDYLDMATALSGTGPAYVFMFMEAMVDAGVHMGFSRRVAEKLVLQTIRGSVEYAAQAGRHVATLRNQVTSPGGTSAEALYHLEKGGFRTVISRAIWAAYQRSVSLGEGKKQKGPEV